ncbi:MAG: tetratricopeptide repeat protein [Bryobacteraceae bacterium]|nr:tetratricopeptide repeat protein [Bryobacteraceae bacterium]
MGFETGSASCPAPSFAAAGASLARSVALLALSILPLMGQNPTIETEIIAIQGSIQAGNQTKALKEIEAALSRFPKAAGIFNLRGIVRAQRGQLALAREDFQSAVSLSPGLIPAWQNLARACQFTPGQDAETVACAVSAWQRVLLARPADIEARASLATVYEWQGRFTDSLRELQRLPERETARSSLLALRCANLAGLGRTEEALALARTLAQSPEFSEADAGSILPVLNNSKNAPIVIALLEKLDVRGGVSATSLKHLAVAYEQIQRLADARKTLERVALQEPGNVDPLYELARVAYGQKDLEGSLGYLAHVRDLTPNDARVHFLFGLVTMQMELPVEARKSLEKALSLDRQNPEFNYALGAAILSGGDGGTASKYLKIFVAARPAEARGHFALGVAYFTANDYDQCRSEMRIAGKDPKIEAGAEFFLGRIARIEENLNEAASHLELSTKLSPSFAEGYAELARVYIRQERLEGARAALDRAISLDPDSFQVNAALVLLYQKTHDPRLAEQGVRLRKLDADRSKRQELMLRTIEVRPY